MKSKILWVAFSILTLLLSAAFTPPIPEGPLPVQNSSHSNIQTNSPVTGAFLATISPVQGEVFWREETDKDWDAILNEQGLDSGNQVLTRLEGRARIEYFDGIIVRVGPHTLFTVSEQTQTQELNLISRIRLLMGQIFIKHGEGYYHGKFEIETPSGLAAVKGTMMSVQVTADGQTLVTCLEGICSLSNDKGLVTLTAGQGASIEEEDQPPQFAEIEDWQLNDWFQHDPETINVALQQGLIDQIPESCDTATGENCLPASFHCDPLTGSECNLYESFDPINGEDSINENIINPDIFLDCVLTGTCSEIIDPIIDPETTVIENPVNDTLPENNIPANLNTPDSFLETLLDGLSFLENLRQLESLRDLQNLIPD